MADAPALGIAEMPFAVPSDDEKAIVFRFNCHDGSEHTFACPPDVVPIIVARLLAANQRLAMAQHKPTMAIVAKKSQISVNEEEQTVGLSLFPTEQTGVPFVLSPRHAQKISTDLAHAAATLDPRDPQASH